MSIVYTEVDLGAVLLEKKLITESQLEACVQQQRLKGGYLSQHLIDRGYIKDSDLTTCLTCQYGYCYLPLDAYAVAENVLNIIPLDFLRSYCVVPIEKTEKLLTVVMADPTNKGVVDALRQLSGCEIIVFVSCRQEIQNALGRYYSTQLLNIDLDRYSNDPSLRDEALYIHSNSYSGPNRRRYIRRPLDLNAEYFLYPYAVKTKTRNISMSGVSFDTYLPLAKGAQLALSIHLEGHGDIQTIITVVEIARCESRNRRTEAIDDDSLALYDVGGFFNFISEKDQGALAAALRNPSS